MKRVLRSTLALCALCAFTPAADANSIGFGLADYSLSTVSTGGVNLFSDPATAPALPPDASFTLPTLGPGETQLYLPQNVGRFIRYEFDLPDTFSNLTFRFTGLVNDEFALYLNDVVIAQQTSTGIDNFFAPLPAFTLDATGQVADLSASAGVPGKLEYLLTTGMQGLFRAGRNELTLFGTDTLEYGSIVVADGQITHDVMHAVPAPPLAGIFAVGAAGLLLLRRRSGRH
jgi:hypothetical protein